MKPKNKGLQTLPDKHGKIKQCNPERSFPCGKACLSITSDILSRCQKNLVKTTQNKALKLLESLKPLKLKQEKKTITSKSTKKKTLSTEKQTIIETKPTTTTDQNERNQFKEDLSKPLPSFYTTTNKSLLTNEKYNQLKETIEVKDIIGNPPHEEELVALKNYTGSDGYSLINTFLRNIDAINKDANQLVLGYGDDKIIKENEDRLNLTSKMISAGLESMPNYEGKVRRATQLPNDILDYYYQNKGKIIEEKGFLSTTKSLSLSDEDLLKKFAVESDDLDYNYEDDSTTNVLYNINSKKGKNITLISDYGDEEEILFQPNSKFKVKSIKQKSKYTIIELEQV